MVWKDELPSQNTLAGGVKDGLQGTMELEPTTQVTPDLRRSTKAVSSAGGRADLPGLLDSQGKGNLSAHPIQKVCSAS